MLRRFLPLLLLLTLLALGRGQDDERDQPDGPIKMNPDLALAIPLLQQGHDVTLKFPILINPSTVLRPGMVLRVIYVPPMPSESENLATVHKGDLAESYARSNPTTDTATMSPAMAHEIERQRRTVWEVPINFQLALAQLPTDSLHLIYAPTSDNRNLRDERFSFFEGLFLGSPSPGVWVLGVEVGSKAEQAGFKAGDQILVVSGKAVSTDLSAFPMLYATSRQAAQDGDEASFPFVVRSPPEEGTHTLNFPMPPSIKKMLNEGL